MARSHDLVSSIESTLSLAQFALAEETLETYSPDDHTKNDEYKAHKEEKILDTQPEHFDEIPFSLNHPTALEESVVKDAFYCMDHACSIFNDKCRVQIPNVVLDTAVSLFRELLQNFDYPHPLLSDNLWWLSYALCVRYAHYGQATDIQESINLFLEIMQSDIHSVTTRTTRNDNESVENLAKLANKDGPTLQRSNSAHASLTSHLTSALRGLDSCNDINSDNSAHKLRSTLEGCPLRGSVRSSFLRQLRTILLTQNHFHEHISPEASSYFMAGAEALVDVARSTLAAETNRKWAAALYIEAQFDKLGGEPKLDRAISIYREVNTEVSKDSDAYSGALKDLADSLMRRYNLNGHPDVLDESITLDEDALALRASHHPGRFISLFALSNALMARFKRTSLSEDFDRAVLLSTEAVGICVPSHPLRSRVLGLLGDALRIRYGQTGQNEDFKASIQLNREAISLHTAPTPLRSCLLQNLAIAYFTRFQRSSHRADLDEAITLYQQSYETCSTLDVDNMSNVLGNFAQALRNRFEHTGQPGDLDESIRLSRETLSLRPARFHSLNDLALAIFARFKQNGNGNDLEEAISLYEQACTICPTADVHNRPNILDNLAQALIRRWEETGRQNDIDESIRLSREALSLRAPLSPKRPHSLSTLALAVFTRYKQDGQRQDLDEAISLYVQSCEICPTTDLRNRPQILHNHAQALGRRFLQTGQLEDLDQSIQLNREALSLRAAPNPDRSHSLNTLALSVFQRFKQTGRRDELEEAICLYEQSYELCLPTDVRNRPKILGNLAQALGGRFDQAGQQTDLDECIRLTREALSLCAPLSPSYRLQYLNNLAHAYLTRFRQAGQRDDLDEAIALLERSLHLCAATDTHAKLNILGNLAFALDRRYEQTGQQGDIDESIRLHKEALSFHAAPHPDRPLSLTNLACAYNTRFVQSGRREDRYECMSLAREALDLCFPGHPLRPTIVSNLATAHAKEYKRTGQKGDLDWAIRLNREVLSLGVDSDPFRPFTLNNLALVLIDQFMESCVRDNLVEAISLLERSLQICGAKNPYRSIVLDNLAWALSSTINLQTAQKDDVDRCILLNKEALSLRPLPSPTRPQSLNNLAAAYVNRFKYNGQRTDLEEAIGLRREAVSILASGTSARFRTAKSWSYDADQYGHITAIEAYDEALQSLSQMASLNLDTQSRQELIRAECDGIARNAAQYAIGHHLLEKAVEYLEEGRAVFWSQVLHIRSPFDGLRQIRPELADELTKIALELELGSHRKTFVEHLDNRSKEALEQEALRLKRLAEEWSRGLNDVRKLEGFENFLRPRRFASLQVSASQCPLVFLIPNSKDSDCLIMTSATIHHIPLSDLSTKKLHRLVEAIKHAFSQTEISESSIHEVDVVLDTDTLRSEAPQDWERATKGALGGRLRKLRPLSDSLFEFVLKELWDNVIKPIIEFLGLQKSEDPPPLRWCPTGVFTFLPLHAAGCYSIKRGTLECASDYMVSSYIPTISWLLLQDEFTGSASSNQPFKMMVVVNTELPHAIKELEVIRKRVPNECLEELGMETNDPAQVDTVYSRLPSASIVHFACHGTQSHSNPLDSALHVQEGDSGKLTMSKIIQQPLPNGSLAFLCACETGMGDATTPDEAMSLGASLLFSGFRKVVATMWGIRDEDGPTIADAFYEELFRGPTESPNGKTVLQPNVIRSSQALHVAVKSLRESGVEFRRWVPFIHLG